MCLFSIPLNQLVNPVGLYQVSTQEENAEQGQERTIMRTLMRHGIGGIPGAQISSGASDQRIAP